MAATGDSFRTGPESALRGDGFPTLGYGSQLSASGRALAGVTAGNPGPNLWQPTTLSRDIGTMTPFATTDSVLGMDPRRIVQAANSGFELSRIFKPDVFGQFLGPGGITPIVAININMTCYYKVERKFGVTLPVPHARGGDTRQPSMSVTSRLFGITAWTFGFTYSEEMVRDIEGPAIIAASLEQLNVSRMDHLILLGIGQVRAATDFLTTSHAEWLAKAQHSSGGITVQELQKWHSDTVGLFNVDPRPIHTLAETYNRITENTSQPKADVFLCSRALLAADENSPFSSKTYLGGAQVALTPEQRVYNELGLTVQVVQPTQPIGNTQIGGHQFMSGTLSVGEQFALNRHTTALGPEDTYTTRHASVQVMSSTDEWTEITLREALRGSGRWGQGANGVLEGDPKTPAGAAAGDDIFEGRTIVAHLLRDNLLTLDHVESVVNVVAGALGAAGAGDNAVVKAKFGGGTIDPAAAPAAMTTALGPGVSLGRFAAERLKIAATYISMPLTGAGIETMLSNNIPLPFLVYGIRPFARFSTVGAIATKRGANVVFLSQMIKYEGFSTSGLETQKFIYHAGTGTITENATVRWPHLLITAVLDGYTTKACNPMSFDKFRKELTKGPMTPQNISARGDVIFLVEPFAVKGENERVPEVLSYDGNVFKYAITLDKNKQIDFTQPSGVPGLSVFYNQKWFMENYNPASLNKPGRTSAQSVALWRAAVRTFNPKLGQWKRTVQQGGPLGKDGLVGPKMCYSFRTNTRRHKRAVDNL